MPDHLQISLTSKLLFQKKEDPWGCGIACLRAQLSSLGEPPSYRELARQARECGALTVEQGSFLSGFPQLVSRYGFRGRFFRWLFDWRILRNLRKGRPVIVSLKSEHLVLVCGVKIEDGKIKDFEIFDPNEGDVQWVPFSTWRALRRPHGFCLA